MLLEKLLRYSESGIYPMHMPGHKRNIELSRGVLPFGIDITEIHGFDNLADPRGVLLETSKLASKLYGSEKSYLLTGGATLGILASIGALTKRGDTVIMARNCHMSVYNAVSLFGLETVFVYPETDARFGVSCGIEPASIEEALTKHPETRLVVITSPTYDGVVSDVRAIAQAARKKGIPLIVDEAHGAHFGFSDYFPNNAARLGADVSVMSLHKTLPALTQCALLHTCGGLVDGGEIFKMLSILQTSSPSYVLTASIASCLSMLVSRGGELFEKYAERLENFSRQACQLKKLEVLCHGNDSAENHPGFHGFDSGKLVIGTQNTDLTGVKLVSELRVKHKIELEMGSAAYALAMTSIADTDDGFKRLTNALTKLDGAVGVNRTIKQNAVLKPPKLERAAATGDFPRRGAALTELPLGEAVGRVSGEFLRAYPPGVPIIVPGEVISREVAHYLTHLAACGVELISSHSTKQGLVSVI